MVVNTGRLVMVGRTRKEKEDVGMRLNPLA